MREPTPEQRKKGKAFEDALDKNELSKAEFARKMGLPQESGAQTVNNWTDRGVSTKQSVLAAKLLGCRPDEISLVNTKAPPAVREPRASYRPTGFRTRLPTEELVHIFENLDEDRQQRLLDYARDQAKASQYDKSGDGRREELPSISG